MESMNVYHNSSASAGGEYQSASFSFTYDGVNNLS